MKLGWCAVRWCGCLVGGEVLAMECVTLCFLLQMWWCMLSGLQHEKRTSLNATVVCVNKQPSMFNCCYSTLPLFCISLFYCSIVNVSAMQQELRGRRVDVVDVVMSTQHG